MGWKGEGDEARDDSSLSELSEFIIEAEKYALPTRLGYNGVW
jgi:hypothetical protein